MGKLEKICTDMMLEAQRDYVGLWEVVNAVERDFRPANLGELRLLTLRIVRCLLAKGIQAVDLEATGPGCIPWKEQERENVLKRIEDEWNALGHEPDIGDIVWFNYPNKNSELTGC